MVSGAVHQGIFANCVGELTASSASMLHKGRKLLFVVISTYVQLTRSFRKLSRDVFLGRPGGLQRAASMDRG